MEEFCYTILVVGNGNGGVVYHNDAKQTLNGAWELSKVIRDTEFGVSTGSRIFFVFKNGDLIVARAWEDFYLGSPDEEFNALRKNICGYPGAQKVLEARKFKGFEAVARVFYGVDLKDLKTT
jgi:hypothetical protein